MSGKLIVCPTPIGNLEDITLRVLAALRSADVVACEDTRRTGVLLERYGVSASLVPYHEHNERERTPDLVERMRGGAVVALVSDAGMPLVSDPGDVLVQGCVAAGLEVVYSTTDPPLKALRRVIPPLNLGSVRLDLGFMVLLIVVLIIRNITSRLAAGA